MRIPIFQVDAFASRRFTGNPAAVMLMQTFPEDQVLQAIAAENNLAETAFLVADADHYQLRWFTPTVEVPLCGHATLASAAVVMEKLEPARTTVIFHTKSGPLKVIRTMTGYLMDFPSRPSVRIDTPDRLIAALHVTPVEVFANEFNYLAVLQSPQQVRDLMPDMAMILSTTAAKCMGVIVTALGEGMYDFTSRYFAPVKGIPEDPVTGAAHCMLAPYWGKRLDKVEFHAYQASSRGGEVTCRLVNDRVELEGCCVFYMQGEVEL